MEKIELLSEEKRDVETIKKYWLNKCLLAKQYSFQLTAVNHLIKLNLKLKHPQRLQNIFLMRVFSQTMKNL